MTWFLFLLALFPLILIIRKYQKRKGAVPSPPAPPGLPFIGNLLQFYNTVPHLYLWKLSKKYGPVMSLQLGFVPTLVISSAKMAKVALKTQDLEFAGRPPLISHQKLSYNGLDIAFSTYNDYWREMKKICVIHLFSAKRVQSFHPIREDEVSKMMKKISKLASASEIINLSEIFLSLTCSIICRIAFGKSYNDEGSARSKFHDLLDEAQAVMGGFFVSDYFPLLGWMDKLSGMSTRLEKACKELDDFYQRVIEEHLDEKRTTIERDDIIGVLLQLRKDQLFTNIDLTFDHIKAVIMDIFLAGTDTSATTLVWAMTRLMKNPGVMKKVQEEVRNNITTKGIICENDLKKLSYLKLVVKETLRLHPPAPLLLERETTQKCYINGYEIGPKTMVYVNAWAIGRDPESWECPDEFFPERFMGTSIDYLGQDFEFIPFGAGRRRCPGMYLGTVTVELALANLLYSFDWELPPSMKKEDIDSDELRSITIHNKNAICHFVEQYHVHMDCN